MKQIDVNASCRTEDLWFAGQEAGLSPKVLKVLRLADTDLRLTLEVNEETGDAKIVEINGEEWPPRWPDSIR